ncbi:MAG: hypothetical protein JWM40_300, partial [Frankiales bacterium]|nr:hypothetical protein [Frankiales bacterium]
MTQPLATARPRTPLHSSWFAFVATTLALVLLASLGTAILVQFGSGGSGVTPPRAISPVASGPALRPPAARPPIAVDRVVGSFRAPAINADNQQPRRPLTLGDLLSPPRVPVSRPTPGEPTAPLAFPTSFPTSFPTALPTGPPPSPVALPLPVPVPGPIT